MQNTGSSSPKTSQIDRYKQFMNTPVEYHTNINKRNYIQIEDQTSMSWLWSVSIYKSIAYIQTLNSQEKRLRNRPRR